MMTALRRWYYDLLQVFFRALSSLLFRLRADGRRHLPASGGALLLSNHQSFLDPLLIGIAADRRLSYVARKELFRFPPFRWLIQSLNAIAIDRDRGLAGLKETLKRLKQDEVVLLFPEGTRSPDGEMAPLKPGFLALARRGRVPLVPVALDGAWQSWPRWQKLPRPSVIQIEFGRPIGPEEIEGLSDEALLAVVEARMRECFDTARMKRRRRLMSQVPLDAPPPRSPNASPAG